MPPSRHSSSSHRSGGSHRSSGPSHHSYSSHRSSYSSSSGSGLFGLPSSGSSSFGHSGSSHRGRISTYDADTGFTRDRRNQPTGYVSSGSASDRPKAYHCSRHDYMYYSKDWTDSSTGKYFEKGFYDETGKHYKNVTIKDARNKKILFRCEYCGTEVKAEWESGEKPSCPNCSAQLQEVATDELAVTSPFDQFDYTPDPGAYDSMGSFGWLVKMLFVVVAVIIGLVGLNSASDDFDNPRSNVVYNTNPVSINTIYVPELGHSCMWWSTYESYYDQTTDCYFYYNKDIDYPDWQYWYEGISSDYGDYGWMEYELETDTWFIETDNGVWIELPEKYNKDNLWHTTVLPSEDN